MWPIGSSRCGQNSNSKAFKKSHQNFSSEEVKEKEKEKDNQYKLKRPMAIAIGLNTMQLRTEAGSLCSLVKFEESACESVRYEAVLFPHSLDF